MAITHNMKTETLKREREEEEEGEENDGLFPSFSEGILCFMLHNYMHILLTRGHLTPTQRGNAKSEIAGAY